MTETTGRTSAATEISPADLRSRLGRSEPPRLLDVRTPGEFDAGHIPSAVNVPLDRVRSLAPTLAGSGTPLVLICQAGSRAEAARGHLAAAGAVDTVVLTGGMNAWSGGGGETTAARAGRWTLERQVRFVAGALVLIGILISIAWPPARYFSGLIGAGLVFAAVSNTCMMGLALGRLPYNRGRSCDIDAALDKLTAR